MERGKGDRLIEGLSDGHMGGYLVSFPKVWWLGFGYFTRMDGASRLAGSGLGYQVFSYIIECSDT